jgi:light-regulated signal transduction histidine kinase (bacteriophytochrome)
MKPAAEPRNKSAVADDKDARIATLEAQVDRLRQEMRGFSYSVSHDLRAPLRAIEGFGRILLEDYGKLLDEEGQRFLQHVLNNAQTMTTLIDDLLTYHRLNEKSVSKASVDVTQIAREVLDAAKPEPPPQIKLPQLPSVTADPALLRVAFEQLIGNALKFSKREAHPVLEFGAQQIDGEQIYWIKDNGVGFDMQYANKLFQVFQKLQKEPDFSGNGIGLALVKRVADKHNGRVWAEAQLNQGATFFLALPRAATN